MKSTRKGILKASYPEIISLCNSISDNLSHGSVEECIQPIFSLESIIHCLLDAEDNDLTFFRGSFPPVISSFHYFIDYLTESCNECDEINSILNHPVIIKIRRILELYKFIIPNDKSYSLLVFPGLGKTSFARNHHHAYDLDFGHLRRSLYDTPEKFKNSGNSYLFYEIYLGMVKSWMEEYQLILINDYHPLEISTPVADEIRNSVKFMIIPSINMKMEILWGIVDRGQSDFANLVDANFEKWINGWLDFANEHGIPTIITKFHLNAIYEYFCSENFIFDSHSLAMLLNELEFKNFKI